MKKFNLVKLDPDIYLIENLHSSIIFSDIFYSQIQKNLPAQNLMTSLPELYPEQPGFKNYKDRYVMDFNKNESINKQLPKYQKI